MLDHMITIREENVDKAIEKGLIKLGISREQAEIHVISEGKRGLFGFGKQDAIVEIIQKNDYTLKEITNKLEAEQLREEKVLQEEIPIDNSSLEIDEQANEMLSPSLNNLEATKEKSMIHEGKNNESNENIENIHENFIENVESLEGLTLEESSERVAHYIDNVIKAYGAQSDTEFEISGSQVIFNIDTDKSGLVIGKHGKIINSLQILSHTLLQAYYRKRVTVLLNVGDYRDRRATVLEQIADRTADEVIQTRQTVILDPLPAYERKQIHAHLAKYENIKTHSEGKEPNRYLVVEYESDSLL